MLQISWKNDKVHVKILNTFVHEKIEFYLPVSRYGNFMIHEVRPDFYKTKKKV